MRHPLRLVALCLLGSTTTCLPGGDDRNSDHAQESKGAAKVPAPVAAMVAVPAAGLDCLGGTGPSNPELFISFFSSVTSGTCPSSACVDFVMFDTSCRYTLQLHDQQNTVELGAADCAAFTRWLSSDLLISALRDPVECGDGTGNESAEIRLQSGSAQRKYAGCGSEPYVIHRDCLAKIRATYFPGM
jgi:hypothetical protein